MHTFDFLAEHGALVLFWVIFVEQIGFPLPALPLLVAAGALVATENMSLAAALLVPVAASLPPDLAWYYLGRQKGGKVLGFLCRLSLEPDSCVRDTENVFHRNGPRALLLAKFVPGFSTVAPPLAGIVGMPATTFILYDLGGTLIWAAVSAGVGALFSNQLEQLIGLFDQAGGLMLVILLLGLAGFVGYKFYHRQKFLRHLRMAKISVDELKRRLDAGESISVVDVRHPLALDLDPESIPGAINFTLEDIEHRHHEIPRDRDIVLYCSCPNEVSSARTAFLLKKKGIHRVRPLEGGLDAWRERQFPVERRVNIELTQ
ncbi:MAG TPA: VTT domain-containing protein [Nitrospira sp.]|nr:VTT domain-containing protein [Nitrospira sp.]MCW5792714.1 VTT domain-containing protein [Nitrospira sp.]HMV56757.1 VTT domain-containing protein [Nitrospira sp.]HMW88184.1 VTT domain-containing protein [Nitrospira sp.]HMX92926.1 VTT domain-containing protein [Nitrospira sp.]